MSSTPDFCNSCIYAMPAPKPLDTGVMLMELTCYRRSAPNYLKPAVAHCSEFDSIHNHYAPNPNLHGPLT